MNNVEHVTEVIGEYFGGWFFPVLLAAVLAAIFLRGDKKTRIFTGISAALLLLIYNDAFYWICKKVGMTSEYYRFLWMLPVIPLGAVLLAKCREKLRFKFLQVIFLVLIFAVAFQSGNTYLTKEEISFPENIYGVPDSILEVVQELKEHREVKEPVVLCDEFVALRIRQLDPSVKLSMKRRAYLNYARGYRVPKKARTALNLTVHGKIQKKKRFQKFLKKKNVEFVVLSNSVADEIFMETVSCRPVSKTENYTIFQVT